MARLKADEVETWLRKTRGNQAEVARRLGVTRSAVSKCVSRHPSLQAVMAEEDAAILDDAESALYKAVLTGEPWAVKWLLATKGKGRGYVERQEVTGKDGGELVIRVEYADVDIDTAAPTFSAEDRHP